MPPKSRAEIQRAYRERKKLREGVVKKPKKTRAEIQQAYRERLKTAGKYNVYREEENKRKRLAYVPTELLDENEKKRRRMDNQEKARRFRDRQKSKKNAVQQPEKSASPNDETTPSPLIVKLDFHSSKRSSSRKRISRGLSKAHRAINDLKDANKKLLRKNWALSKKLQRQNGVAKKRSNVPAASPKHMTPRRKTRKEIREAGLSPKSIPPPLRKKILFANAMMSEIKDTANSQGKDKQKNKRRTVSIVSGKILKKYRCLRLLNKESGFSRKMLARPYFEKKRMQENRKRVENSVISFLETDDNSRMMPGKADFKSCDGKKIQARILNDYLYNLHVKYQAEHPDAKVSRSLFCKLRPKHFITTSFSSRHTCLCQRHQNMSLKLRALKAVGVNVTVSPDAFIKTASEQEVITLTNNLPQKIKFCEWKRVEVEGKKKMKILEFEKSRDDFKELWKKEVFEFENHTKRVKVQYEELKRLKESFPKNHAIIQMDFAENYTCQQVEEVQSAYWNSSMVTLHPAVVYYKNEDGKIAHQSQVLISDELGHNSSTVYAFIRRIVPFAKVLVPELEHVHYVTDSPTSQYRNKSVFEIVRRHEEEFAVAASWNYFEAGHGKGPCDGVGGTAKRMADEAVKQHKATIQDASDFFAWAEKYQSSSQIKYTFVPKDECATARLAIEAFGGLQPLPGTMKVHAIACSNDKRAIIARNTSCFCQKCFADGKFNESSDCGWKKHFLKLPTLTTEEEQVQTAVNDWVSAVYDNKWYIGQVLGIDNTDSTLHVTFMESSVGNSFKWPKRADELWIPKSSVLAVIQPPVTKGRSKRVFTIELDTAQMIRNLHEAWLGRHK